MIPQLINNRTGIHIQALEHSDLSTIFSFSLGASNYSAMWFGHYRDAILEKEPHDWVN